MSPTHDKREPAFTDVDLMWFGKFKNLQIQDVPASYLKWWRDENKEKLEELSKKGLTPPALEQALKLYNYIYNEWNAIQYELKHNEED